MTTWTRVAGAALAALSLAGMAYATSSALHEDDPKVLDRQAPFRGPAWRGVLAARGSKILPAIQFPKSNVTLLSWLPLNVLDAASTSGNVVWGYVSPSGREYALMGISTGIAIVEVSDPTDAQVVDFVPGPVSLWRDIRTFGHYAYTCSEGGDGIQVIDLAQIDSGNVQFLTNITAGGDTTATHTLGIDELSGFLYRAGGGSNGLRIYSLANPASPTFVGSWSTKYVHECTPVTYTSGAFAGHQIVFACGGFNGGFTSTGVTILDVTNKANITTVASFSYPNPAFSHQAWLSPDRTLLYLNDELDENGSLPTTTHVFNVTNLNAPLWTNSFTNGNTAVGHNIYTKNNYVFEANYRSGLRVFDTSSSASSPTEVAWFDTYPDSDSANFNGLWTSYSYLPSGIVLGSDLEKGLFVWWVGAPLVNISLLGAPGSTIAPDVGSLSVNISGATLVPGSPKMHFDYGTGVQTVDLVDQGNGQFTAFLPPLPCGLTLNYWFTAESSNGITWSAPEGGDSYSATIAPAQTVLATYDMESGAGWTGGAPGDTASTGIWTRVNPVGTAAQPEDDHTVAPGSLCWVTGQGSVGGASGDNDVDGGKTTLLSPIFDLSSASDPRVRYFRWYSNNSSSAPGEDTFLVEISNNGGSSWLNAETVGPNTQNSGGWLQHEVRVRDFLTPTANMRLRFVASDLINGSIVEAALDDLEITDLICPDCNGNLSSDGSDIVFGSSLDLDQNQVPDECQPLSANTGAMSVAVGGAQNFALRAGAAQANDLYLLLGSATGTSPGLPLGSVVLPLAIDAYTSFVANAPNQPPLSGSLGVLNVNGEAGASFSLPAGSDPSLAGLRLWHAYVTLDVATSSFTLASNAIPLDLLP